MSGEYQTKKEEIIDLKGLKVVVTANELESSEHRGISSYTKNLIKALSNAGAEVWLLTELYTPYTSKKNNNKKINFVNLSYILESLTRGFEKKPEQINTILNNFFILKPLLILKDYLVKLFTSFRLKRYPVRRLKYIRNSQIDSPYSRIERMEYLKYVSGFISARRIYYSSLIRIILRIKSPVKIDLNNFDLFITSCPLNIRPINTKNYIQTIHDLIPLEYGPYPYMDSVFLNRLNETLYSKRLFISKTTESKFNSLFDTNNNSITKSQDKKISNFDKVAIQPPTLKISNQVLIPEEYDLVFNPLNTNTKKNYKKIVEQIPKKDGLIFNPFKNTREKKHKQNVVQINPELIEENSLYKFKYILFNASVDPRKNLSLILDAYNKSNLFQRNIKLCICGKIPDKKLSELIFSTIDSSNGIICTGYVNEEIKSQLYLYALATLNSSLIEGFGLPVFDASCLGLRSYVSDCLSHHEIYNLYDFSDFIVINKINNFQGWLKSLNSIRTIESDFEQIAKDRIERYKLFEKRIENKFLSSLNSLINNN